MTDKYSHDDYFHYLIYQPRFPGIKLQFGFGLVSQNETSEVC